MKLEGRLTTPETLAKIVVFPGCPAVTMPSAPTVATLCPEGVPQVTGPMEEVTSCVPLNTVALKGWVWPCDSQFTEVGLTTIRSTLG
jgi:hypothetical protein